MLDANILNNSLNDKISYQEFFHAFGYEDNDRIFLRAFIDNKEEGENDPGRNFDILLYRFDSILPTLRQNNDEGRGIFFVVNGGGQSDQEVKKAKRARALFVDMDDVSLEEQLERISAFPREPSIILRSKRSLHPYWLTLEGDIKYFRELQQRLIQYFKSDPVIKNESRVMRLYGFDHRKADPVEVKLIKFNPELTYTQQQFNEILPPLRPEVKTRKKANTKRSGELVQVGHRYEYVMRKLGEYVARLKDSADDESILSLLESDFRMNCADPDNVKEDFREKYLPVIKKLRSLHEEAEKDPDFYSNALKAWKAENPGREFDKAAVSWEEVAAAGIRAKEAGAAVHDTENKDDQKSLIPHEFSDVAQAELFAREYGDIVRYSRATHFLKYNGKVWEESDLKVQRLSQELTARQMKEVQKLLRAALKKKNKLIEEDADKEQIKEAERAVNDVLRIRKEVIKRRSAQRIAATMTEAAPLLEVDVKDLDRDGFLLNTPAGTVDLRTGIMKAHDPRDYCTKITAVSPGEDNAEMFQDFLDQITCNDQDLECYLQETAGETIIGEVKREGINMATGGGGNGKSTNFNVQARALGDYAGLISSDVLITNNRKNKSPELAELRGKRLVIAAELEEGTRLDTAVIKKIASTDPIRAEKKYKDPFDFIPSHTIVLYTNHLPRVGARDSGTWDRLRVIPFNARFRNSQTEIKDYASVLFEKCGPAVLSWMIEGARRFIENGFKIETPECVQRAIEEYRQDNDWLSLFIAEKCYVGASYSVSGAALYTAYREHCDSMGEFPRHSAELKKALETVGVQYKKTNSGAVYKGIRLKGWHEIQSDQISMIKHA